MKKYKGEKMKSISLSKIVGICICSGLAIGVGVMYILNGLLGHGMQAYGYNPIFGKGWEEKKIKKYMEDDNF